MTRSADAIFCDDLRLEQNGKVFVIGVYTDEIIIPVTSTSLVLCCWIRFFDLEKGIHRNNLVMRMNDQIVASFAGQVESLGTPVCNVFLAHFQFPVEGPGNLSVTMELEDGRSVDAGSIRISTAESSSTT